MFQTFFNENTDLCSLRREILSQLSKDRLSLIGQDLLANLGPSSSGTGPPSDARLKEFISLRMDVMLAGGLLAVVDSSVDEIRARALAVRRKVGRKDGLATAKEEGIRAVIMGLCDANTSGTNLLYSFGHANRYWMHWFSAATTDADRAKWRLEITAAATENTRDGNSSGTAAVVIAKVAHATS